MILTLVTAPAEYPVTLDQCKGDLKIQHTAEDDLIEDYIAAATDYAQEVLGKKIISQTWDYSFRFPDDCGRVWLPLADASSITSIKYFDGDNVEQTLSVGDFYFYKFGDTAYLTPKPDISWPTVYSRTDAMTVRFVVGYGAAGSVPPAISRAIRLLVAHWFEHRTAVIVNGSPMDVPFGVESLLNIHRIGWVA